MQIWLHINSAFLQLYLPSALITLGNIAEGTLETSDKQTYQSDSSPNLDVYSKDL